MNLVSKEYVACRVDTSGALVLSEFTGAAAELGRFRHPRQPPRPRRAAQGARSPIRSISIRPRPRHACAGCGGSSAARTSMPGHTVFSPLCSEPGPRRRRRLSQRNELTVASTAVLTRLTIESRDGGSAIPEGAARRRSCDHQLGRHHPHADRGREQAAAGAPSEEHPHRHPVGVTSPTAEVELLQTLAEVAPASRR